MKLTNNILNNQNYVLGNFENKKVLNFYYNYFVLSKIKKAGIDGIKAVFFTFAGMFVIIAMMVMYTKTNTTVFLLSNLVLIGVLIRMYIKSKTPKYSNGYNFYILKKTIFSRNNISNISASHISSDNYNNGENFNANYQVISK